MNFFILALLASCSHASLKSSSPFMISPEAQGGTHRYSLNIGFERRPQHFVDTDGQTPSGVSVKNEYIGDDMEGPLLPMRVDGSLGIFEKIDLLFISDISSRPLPYLGVKWQFWGEAKTKSKKGNTSLSLVYAEAHSGKKTISSEDAVKADIWGYRYQLNVTHFKSTAQLIYGRRLEDNLLFYGNLNNNYESFSGSLSSQDTNLHGKDVANQTYFLGLACGFIYEKKYIYQVEINLSDFHWSNSRDGSFVGLAFKIGKAWDSY